MIKATDFIHPEDAAALRQLESIPGFPTLVKKLMSMGLEQLQYGVNMHLQFVYHRVNCRNCIIVCHRFVKSWVLSNRSFISLWILILTHGPLAIQRFL